MNRLLNLLHRPDAGYHLLRVSVSGMMLLHGVAKVRGGLADIERTLATFGLPEFVAYGVLVGEVAAPILVLIGAFVAPAALVMVINMLFAIGLAHAAQIFTISVTGGWGIELQALFLFGSLALACLAPVRQRSLNVEPHAAARLQCGIVHDATRRMDGEARS